jgi:hypothetical protein
MRIEGSGLMQRHGHPHGGKEPPVVPMPTHPAPFQGEDVLDDALHGLDGLAALLAPSTIDRPIQDVEHLLSCRGLLTLLARCGQQGHAALPLKLGKQIFIIGFTVRHHGLDHTAKVAGFQPQTCRFMGPVAHIREGPQQTGGMGHQPERPRPIHPPITATVAPRGFPVQAMPSFGGDALSFVLGVPDRSPGLVHHLIATDDLPRSILEERFETHILEPFQAGRRLFLTARVIGSQKSAATSAAARRDLSRTDRSSDECPSGWAPDT